MPNAILTRAIDALAQRRDLSADETAEVLAEVMHGEVSETQIAGFLIALRTKGETVDELTGLARTMRELAAHVPIERTDLLDTAGTGGGCNTFNVSTTAALIAAGAGCAVAKHGNRSATSRSGSADLLEALGARIDLDPAGVAACIEEAGFGFMFAPAHHQATRFVIPVRRELAVRTIFNFLGPLTNPAGARRQLIGVSDPAFQDTVAGALARLGVDRALVVTSEDGLDEISIAAATKVVEVNGEEITRYTLVPGDVGVQRADVVAVSEVRADGHAVGGADGHAVGGADGQAVGGIPPDTPDLSMAGGSPEENAAITRAIFQGEPGPRAELAVINAGAAIYAGGLSETIAAGVVTAREALAQGAAAAALERFVRATLRHAPTATAAR
jgi:anthranilate phosphoribosyltransferase